MLQRKTRKRVFYLLILLFLIISPLLIAYTIGYIIDLHRGLIFKVRGVFVKSWSGGFSIYLNGEFQKETSLLSSGALLTGLKPGSYILGLQKDGFKSWEKKIKVESGLVTEIRDILLVPDLLEKNPATVEELDMISGLAETKPTYYKIDRRGNLTDTRLATSSAAILASNIKHFDYVEGKIFLIDKNGFLAELNPGTRAIQTIGRLGFYIDRRPFRFISSPKNYLLVIDSAGGGYLIENYQLNTVLGTEILDAHFDQESQKLLLVRKSNVEMVWLADNSYQPFQKKGARKIIFETKDKIIDALWFADDNQHAVIQTEKGVFLTGIKSGDNPLTLLSEPVEKIYTLPNLPDKIFIKKGGAIYKIEL